MSIPRKATVGEPAPPFQCHAIVDGRIKEISLDVYTASNHWLVLIFFPKAWSFICPTEIRSFSARLEEFLYSRSCAVVFVSTDSEFCLRAWNSTSEMEGGLGGVHVPLVSDSNHKLSKDYGVLNEAEGTAQRALFVIDGKGMLRATSVNDVDVGRSVDEVLRLIDALAFKDQWGEGCPVDWKKGDRGIDISTRSKVEGRVEVEAPRSWTEWARPKIERAWSGASQRTSVPSSNSQAILANRLATSPSEFKSSPTLGGVNGATEPGKPEEKRRPRSLLSAPWNSTSRNTQAQLEDTPSPFKMDQPFFADQQPENANRFVGAAL